MWNLSQGRNKLNESHKDTMKTAQQDTLHTWSSLFIQQPTFDKSMAN